MEKMDLTADAGIAKLRSQPDDYDRIEDVKLRITASSDPGVVSWQAVVFHKDRTKAPGVYVSSDPVEAVAYAIEAAMGQRQSKALYHQDRQSAEEFRQGLEDIFDGVMAYSKTEFEPNQGFVVVVAVADEKRKLFAKFGDRIELRKPEDPVPSGRSDYASGGKVSSSKPRSNPAPAGPSVPGGKKALEDLWKGKFGKYPPRDWKKAELIEKLRAEGLME